MRRAACTTLAVVLAIATPAAAQESVRASAAPPVALVRPSARPITLRVPASLDLPPSVASPFRAAPRAREVKLSEEGLVLVVASCIIGGVILIYLVSRATSH